MTTDTYMPKLWVQYDAMHQQAEASQEGEKGRGKWKVGDKTQGGGVKNICSTKNENDWREGKRSENGFKKT